MTRAPRRCRFTGPRLLSTARAANGFPSRFRVDCEWEGNEGLNPRLFVDGRVGIYAFKPAFRRSLQPIARALSGTHPDTVSYVAVAFALVAGVLLAFAPRWPWMYLLAPVFFFARLACNALDGMLAQSQAVASPRGEVVNELSDRVSDSLILAGLALGGVVHPLLVGGALAITLLVSTIGILAKAAGGARNYAGPMGKADRMAVLGVGSVGAFFAPWMSVPPAAALNGTLAVIALLGLATVVNRTRIVWHELGGRTP